MKQLIAYRFGSYLSPVYGDGKLSTGGFTQAQKDIFTLNPTRPMPTLRWYRIKINSGYNKAWMRLLNADNYGQSNRCHIFTPPVGFWRYEHLTYQFSTISPYIEVSGAGPKDFVLAMEVTDPDAAYILDSGDGPWTSATAVSNPVFTSKDDGTFEVTCATSGAVILVNVGNDDGWAYYDNGQAVGNIQPGTVVKALAVLKGRPSSAVISYTVVDKLLTPTFIDKGTYINIVSPNGATVAWQAKYTKNGGAVQTQNPTEKVYVNSGDTIVAWITDTDGNYTTSSTAQFDKA